MSETSLVELLRANGYKTVEGRDAVLAAIAAQSDGSSEVLCSGYRVFPDGSKCLGCRDCMMPPAAAKQLIDDMQAAVDQCGGKLPWWDQPDNKHTKGQQ